jgi:protein required for attachment to host cells
MDTYSVVVVVDGTRARFLTLEDGAAGSGPKLREHKDLVNPESDMRGRDLWSDVKTGRGRATDGGPAHGYPVHSYDDHREKHEDEFERRFARRVAEETISLVQARPAKQIIVVAQKRMLGFLRPALMHTLRGEVEVRELAKDLSKLNTAELHERLAGEKFLPPRNPFPRRSGASYMTTPGTAKSDTRLKTKKHNPVAKSSVPAAKSKSRATSLKKTRAMLDKPPR